MVVFIMSKNEWLKGSALGRHPKKSDTFSGKSFPKSTDFFLSPGTNLKSSQKGDKW